MLFPIVKPDREPIRSFTPLAETGDFGLGIIILGVHEDVITTKLR